MKQKDRNRFMILLLLMVCVVFSACGKKEEQEETDVERITEGEVDSPEKFKDIGVYLDVDKHDENTEVVYRITRSDIACVEFTYGGLDCKLLGSTVYYGFDLAGIQDTGKGNVTITYINGLNATYNTLKPGRLITWGDSTANYALYINVTADDAIVEEIISHLIFENHYNERWDVVENIDKGSREFAMQVLTVIQNKDLEGLSALLNYPQQLGNGKSVSNYDELQQIPEEEIFTDVLLRELNEETAQDVNLSDDGKDFIIGGKYKNVHFRYMEDGSFKIVQINS